MSETPAVTHNPAASRFELQIDGILCVCEYRLAGTVAHFNHTVVPPALGGRGLAAALVEAGLQWARTEGLKVAPDCSYVDAYMRRHPQTLDLLASA